MSLKPEELVLLKLVLPPSPEPANDVWHMQTETVETYQSTETVSKPNHTRPERGLPFPTLPNNVSGMVTARISLGGLNETRSRSAEISRACDGILEQTPGETAANLDGA